MSLSLKIEENPDRLWQRKTENQDLNNKNKRGLRETAEFLRNRAAKGSLMLEI